MTRIQRLLASAVALAAAATFVLLVTYLGSQSQGPLARVMGAVGVGVGRAENRVLHRVRGPGRAAELAWFENYRRDPALLRSPRDLLVGTFDGAMPGSLTGAIALEQALGTTFPLLHVYAAWGDRPEQKFPRRIAEAIRDLGSVPVITWEPWLTDFDARMHPHLPARDARDPKGLAAIARGDYDAYIDAWATDARAFRQPIFVRFAHEMNDPYRYPWGPQNNEPDEFIRAWRHVVERFRARGADNVVWVWSPHVAYDGYWRYYPGHDVVDWIATGVLNYGNVAYWSRWWTFEEIFGGKYTELAGAGKPIMIAELATLRVGGDAREWLRDALTHLHVRLPRVRAVLFFHTAGDATVTYQALDWTFRADSATVAVVREALAPYVRKRATPGGA